MTQDETELRLDDIQALVQMAIEEDLGPGDVTTEAIAEDTTPASGRFETREEAVIAGLPVVGYVFAQVAERLLQRGHRFTQGAVRFEPRLRDGDRAMKGDTIAEIRGPAMVLLAGERLALNFVQRLSGIATATRRYVDAVKGCPAKILDTRKTTPGWRYLEKYAVRMGGGVNHRIGLYDMVLIKDNHLEIAAARWPGADPVERAIRAAREKAPGPMLIQVEAATTAQVRSAVEAGADLILLDNMSPAQMAEAVGMVRRSSRAILTEASGGVTLDRVRQIAETGVDRISIGALTHSAKAIDIALEM